MDGVPELGGLELIAAVARYGTISGAAREVGVAQQSASSRIRAIERMLGIELFRRTTHGAVPTAQGEVVASWADEVIEAAARFRIGVETLREEHRRELTVAASQTVAAHLLPRWLVALRERQVAAGRAPTAVRLIAGNSTEVEHLVRTGAAELGFIESTVIPDGLSTSTVGQDALIAVVAPEHPWGASESLSTVADAGLVVREDGSGTRRAWEDAVRTCLGREPAAPLAVLPTTNAVRSAVAEGLGPAVLSRRAAADDVRLGRLREVAIDGDEVTRPITALWRGTARDLALTSRELLEVAVA